MDKKIIIEEFFSVIAQLDWTQGWMVECGTINCTEFSAWPRGKIKDNPPAGWVEMDERWFCESCADKRLLYCISCDTHFPDSTYMGVSSMGELFCQKCMADDE